MKAREAWRNIPGFPGFQASSLGRVRGPDRRVREHRVGSHGYPRVYVRVGEKRTMALVHRLVLFAFAGLPKPGHQGRHKDGNPLNPRLDNLCWGTPAENQADSVRHGTANPYYKKGVSHNVGEAHGRAKFTDDLVRKIRASRETCAAWAARLSVSKSAISHIRAGRRWAHVR